MFDGAGVGVVVTSPTGSVAFEAGEYVARELAPTPADVDGHQGEVLLHPGVVHVEGLEECEYCPRGLRLTVDNCLAAR